MQRATFVTLECVRDRTSLTFRIFDDRRQTTGVEVTATLYRPLLCRSIGRGEREQQFSVPNRPANEPSEPRLSTARTRLGV